MKKENLNGKLAFNKASVTELNDSMLRSINGGAEIMAEDGSTILGGPTCTGCVCFDVTIKVTKTIVLY
ncbi:MULTISPECIES: class I lanthipeptide [unclassified Flavobacterium]|uniref:class I lanthipeptide n=1 Tax=unclassified Flavobacterium TaxID=196869 RepID=UPI00360A2D44